MNLGANAKYLQDPNLKSQRNQHQINGAILFQPILSIVQYVGMAKLFWFKNNLEKMGSIYSILSWVSGFRIQVLGIRTGCHRGVTQ